MCLRNFMCIMTLIRSWTSSWCHNGVRLLGDGQVCFACAKNVNCYTDHSRSLPKMVATIPLPLTPLCYESLPFFNQKVEPFPFCLILKWSCDSLESTECGKSNTVWLPGRGFKIPCNFCFYFLGIISVQCKEAQPKYSEWLQTIRRGHREEHEGSL